MVKAAGPAKDDQSIYLGVYRQIINYNNHAAYELEGSDQLYIYFFSSVVRIDFGILSHKKVYGDIKHDNAASYFWNCDFFSCCDLWNVTTTQFQNWDCFTH